MSGFLDGTGVLYLWDKLKGYVDEKFSQIRPSTGADGKSAYQYAVDGGYTGTEKEFQALMADGTTKTYVDNLFSQVAPIIVKVQVQNYGGENTRTYNAKCYPSDMEVPSYFIDFSFRMSEDFLPDVIYVIPPDGYAFTGLYQSFGPVLYASANRNRPEDHATEAYSGRIYGDKAFFDINPSSYAVAFSIVGTFTLEVA